MVVIRSLAWIIWVTILQIVEVGCLWVLRVMIDWWLDIDYVKKAEEWIKRKEKHDK